MADPVKSRGHDRHNRRADGAKLRVGWCTVRVSVTGVRNVLKHHGGRLTTAPWMGRRESRVLEALGYRHYAKATAGGMFEPFVELGDRVSVGQPLGQIHDVTAPRHPPAIQRAPLGGIVFSRHAFCLIEWRAWVAIVAKESGRWLPRSPAAGSGPRIPPYIDEGGTSPMAERLPTRAERFPVMRLTDVERQVSMERMRAYRLARVREQLKLRSLAGCCLFDPVNARYATGRREGALFTTHISGGYVFVATEGPVVVFGGNGDRTADLETVSEVRRGQDWSFFGAGPRVDERIKHFATEIAELIRSHGGGERSLAVDRCDWRVAAALRGAGVEVRDAQEPLELARAIKCPEEIACMSFAIAAAEVGMADMRDALRPGITENELWALLHRANIALGGDWIDARLLNAGDRIVPWGQESSDRMIRAGELVAFDTDMIGPFGYCADISRTFFCGPGRPSARQRELYRLAWEELEHNMALLRPGVTFRELADKAWPIPEDYRENRYILLLHGIGMCDEWPWIAHRYEWDRNGYDGVIEENMTICVESFMAPSGATEGVKLERQVLVRHSGALPLDVFPFEEELLA
jgi:Xaa-Pro dipeptidase